MFRLDDKVRVLEKADNGDVKVGTVDVITDVLRNGEVRVGNRYANWFLGCHGGKLELVKPEPVYPNKPHKHAELIKAWADGADIQAFSTWGGEWQDTVRAPSWHIDTQYRIKPVKSDKDIQIEALEAQAKQLATDIAKLKS